MFHREIDLLENPYFKDRHSFLHMVIIMLLLVTSGYGLSLTRRERAFEINIAAR